MSYPDPCDYCALGYQVNKRFDCRKGCKVLKRAQREWVKEEKKGIK